MWYTPSCYLHVGFWITAADVDACTAPAINDMCVYIMLLLMLSCCTVCHCQVAVLDWFARLWEIGVDDYHGYVTTGTQNEQGGWQGPGSSSVVPAFQGFTPSSLKQHCYWHMYLHQK
jgi:hypothetical protein